MMRMRPMIRSASQFIKFGDEFINKQQIARVALKTNKWDGTREFYMYLTEPAEVFGNILFITSHKRYLKFNEIKQKGGFQKLEKWLNENTQ